MILMNYISPPGPGEEIVLSLVPLCHISAQILDIYYIISVAGTTVFPGRDILNRQDLLWKAISEVISVSLKFS